MELELDGVIPVRAYIQDTEVIIHQDSDKIFIPCAYFQRWLKDVYEFYAESDEEDIYLNYDIAITRCSISEFHITQGCDVVELDDTQIDELYASMKNFGV